MTLSRRSLLKGMVAAGAAAAVSAAPASAREKKTAPADAHGMLYDATLCIGCKACVVACKEFNKMPADGSTLGSIYDAPTDLNGKTKNVIALYKGDGKQSYMKKQCMHCIDPACASVCMLGSFKKRPLGIVTWDSSKCIGCRNCMVACHYNIPKFEWFETFPKMVKCELCSHVTADGTEAGAKPTGKQPGCCSVCPRKAVVFGKYSDLVAMAESRVKANKGKYEEDRVYGITEVGGTQVLYLAAAGVPFDKLGLVKIDEPIPELSETIQHGIYQGFIAPVVLYGALAAVLLKNRNKEDGHGEEKK